MPEKRAFRLTGPLSFLPFILLLIISSCIPQKRLLLLQDKEENDTNKFTTKAHIHKIIPGDELYIRVIGLDSKTFALFNGMPYSDAGIGYTYNPQNQLQSVYSSTYTVNDSGFIPFPLLKKFYVNGLYTDDAQRTLQDSVQKYANFAVVIIKYVNYKVTVLGEVLKPGEFIIDNDQVTIFEAIGLAGDMTLYANKNTVKIIRKTNSGTHMIQVDLTDRSIFGSEGYWLLPDDIVYIAPMRAKTLGIGAFNLATYLSLVTTLVVLYTLIK